MAASPLEAALRVAEVLDQLRINYMVCGSLASTVHGEPRMSQDVDLVADLHTGDSEPLMAVLEKEFYIELDAVPDVAEERVTFSLIARESAQKVDIFALRERPFSREELSRGERLEVRPGVSLRIATAEDTLLAKMEWYRECGEASDQQWRDVLGILKVQEDLDLQYVRQWARELGLLDLLVRALEQGRG